MKNILFINPPNMPFSSSGILIEPIDLLHLTSYAHSLGYNVSLLDMDVRKISANNLSFYLDEIQPDIAIVVFDYHIPLHDGGANAEVNEIFNVIRKRNIPSILGGKAATFYKEDKLKNLRADIFVKHDMEKPLKELLSFIGTDNWMNKLNDVRNIRYWIDDKLIETDTENVQVVLNDYPIPNRKLINLNDYIDVRTILSSRGCNLKCSFCHVPGFWGGWKGRSPEHVAEEILLLQRENNSSKILFLDDNAMARPQRMKEISEILINNNSKAALGCLGTIISFNEDVMKHMFKAGFRWIHYGAESGDDYQLQTMSKKITSQQTRDVIQQTKDIGFRVRTSWILDMPDLTVDGLKRTEDLILEQNSDEIRLHFLTLRLGSFLFEKHKLETKQFIHNPKQNLNISGISEHLISESVERIIQGLKKKGYTIITNPDDFIDVGYLTKINPQLKIASLCPLRYGLGWKYD